MTTRNDRPTASLAHLVTDQDVHAYVDAEVALERRSAVEAHLARHPGAAQRAADDLRIAMSLRAARESIYADAALRDEVARLLAKRAASAPGRRSARRASGVASA